MKEWALMELEYLEKNYEDDDLKNCANTASEAFSRILDYTRDPAYLPVINRMLVQLMNHNPMTPILDNDNEWIEDRTHVSNNGASSVIYHHIRRESLIKNVITDQNGDVKTFYSDTERYVCVDIDTLKTYSGFIERSIINEVLPIEFPYMPTDKARIYVQRLNYDGCVYKAIMYIRTEDGDMVDVKRFFKEDGDTVEEITKEHYFGVYQKAMIEEGHQNEEN